LLKNPYVIGKAAAGDVGLASPEQRRRKIVMALPTRQNPESGALEVFYNHEWVCFEEYRVRQIDEAYQKSVNFLRKRLGEEQAQKLAASLKETPS
jgi:hypothetical protein